MEKLVCPSCNMELDCIPITDPNTLQWDNGLNRYEFFTNDEPCDQLCPECNASLPSGFLKEALTEAGL